MINNERVLELYAEIMSANIQNFTVKLVTICFIMVLDGNKGNRNKRYFNYAE